MSIATELGKIRDALATVDGLRVHTDPGATIEPPAAVIGPPAFRWETLCPSGAPSSATVIVYVIVPANGNALTTLWDLVPAVAHALDSADAATVTEALPGSYSTGGVELPCYEITTEVAL